MGNGEVHLEEGGREAGPAWRRVNSIQSPEDAGGGIAPPPHHTLFQATIA